MLNGLNTSALNFNWEDNMGLMTTPEKIAYVAVLTYVCYLVYHVLSTYPLY